MDLLQQKSVKNVHDSKSGPFWYRNGENIKTQGNSDGSTYAYLPFPGLEDVQMSTAFPRIYVLMSGRHFIARLLMAVKVLKSIDKDKDTIIKSQINRDNQFLKAVLFRKRTVNAFSAMELAVV